MLETGIRAHHLLRLLPLFSREEEQSLEADADAVNAARTQRDRARLMVSTARLAIEMTC